MTVNITFIGLEQVGASLGLALSRQKDYFHRTGIDREPLTSQRAKKIGAIDQVEYRVPNAVENAHIVVLALPVDEIRDMLEVIAPQLRPNAVVIDMSPLHSTVAGWAQEMLPESRYLVSMTPTLNPAFLDDMHIGIDAAQADLFNNSLMVITSSENTHPDAVKLTADIARAAGASPYFAESAEAEGLLAAYDLLPKLASVGLLAATASQPSWKEGQRLAGRSFSKATFPVQLLDESTQLGQSALVNRQNTLRLLDDLIRHLQQIRTYIAEQDSQGLSDMFAAAVKARKDWFARRQNVDKEVETEMKTGSFSETLGRMFGFKPRGKK